MHTKEAITSYKALESYELIEFGSHDLILSFLFPTATCTFQLCASMAIIQQVLQKVCRNIIIIIIIIIICLFQTHKIGRGLQRTYVGPYTQKYNISIQENQFYILFTRIIIAHE